MDYVGCTVRVLEIIHPGYRGVPVGGLCQRKNFQRGSVHKVTWQESPGGGLDMREMRAKTGEDVDRKGGG